MEPLIDVHAREKAKASESWIVHNIMMMDDDSLALTGSEVPIISRGKNKGRPNWKKRDVATEKKVCIQPQEHDEWLLRWETRTGKCSRCQGTGQVVGSLRHHDDVTTAVMGTCGRCDGDGLARPNVAIVEMTL